MKKQIIKEDLGNLRGIIDNKWLITLYKHKKVRPTDQVVTVTAKTSGQFKTIIGYLVNGYDKDGDGLLYKVKCVIGKNINDKEKTFLIEPTHDNGKFYAYTSEKQQMTQQYLHTTKYRKGGMYATPLLGRNDIAGLYDISDGYKLFIVLGAKEQKRELVPRKQQIDKYAAERDAKERDFTNFSKETIKKMIVKGKGVLIMQAVAKNIDEIAYDYYKIANIYEDRDLMEQFKILNDLELLMKMPKDKESRQMEWFDRNYKDKVKTALKLYKQLTGK